MTERIQKILSAHGVASRRGSEKLILDGRVTVNGAIASLGQSAEFGRDEIAVDGTPLAVRDEKVYIMLNKPRGYITTMKDEKGRRTVSELVTGVGTRVYPVGRLDMDSEGLLLMTNDGDFANAVMHPSFNKAKTYVVRVRGDIRRGTRLMQGPMEIEGYKIKPPRVELAECTARGGVMLITISEGRNRQIRKMCALCGLRVESLTRIAVGGLELGSLASGEWRRLTDGEIRLLKDF